MVAWLVGYFQQNGEQITALRDKNKVTLLEKLLKKSHENVSYVKCLNFLAKKIYIKAQKM